jgi:hypothetical protein
MFDIITTCPEHGVIAREPTPLSITYMGKYNPGKMKFCPYCGKPTTINWPDEDSSVSFNSVVKDDLSKIFRESSEQDKYLDKIGE